jgi:hypothetical protein
MHSCVVGGETMDTAVETELGALVRVILGRQAPKEGEKGLPVKRPDRLELSDSEWLDVLVEDTVREVLLAFDLRLKTPDDDPAEIERWKKPIVPGGWIERRKNFRLRIRTSIDDLFERGLPECDASPKARAWKIQIVDRCADEIIERFHLRPASSGPWVLYRRTLQSIGQDLENAQGNIHLFLMSGRASEVQEIESAITHAYQSICQLAQDVRQQKSAEESDV